MFGVFHEVTPLVQGLSLDEAFLDVTASQDHLGSAPNQIARGIKRRIRALTGLTASVGVAPNKLVAKIASELRKPDGLTVVPPSACTRCSIRCPCGAFPASGARPGRKWKQPASGRSGSCAARPTRCCGRCSGATALMRERASGVDERPVLPEVEEKSLSAEDTFEHDIGTRQRPAAPVGAARRPGGEPPARPRARRRPASG